MSRLVQLNGHEPVGHEPRLGRLGHVSHAADLPEPPMAAEKTESCFSGFAAPHFGQAGAGAFEEGRSASNEWLHFRHLYSKIGMFLFSFLRKTIAGNALLYTLFGWAEKQFLLVFFMQRAYQISGNIQHNIT